MVRVSRTEGANKLSQLGIEKQCVVLPFEESYLKETPYEKSRAFGSDVVRVRWHFTVLEA
jgi:hypothetical protein